ncbi:MAG TPA: hypothetical protein VNY30_19880 [Bryobacteraceae bacterium]|nr:hypothetical protein [Bryobacteraceae bacterium]
MDTAAGPARNLHGRFSGYGERMKKWGGRPRPRRTPWSGCRLKRLLPLAVAFLLLSNPIHAQNRREAILHLRDDVSTAMAHVSVEEKQTQKLDHCRQTLLMAAQSGSARATRKDLDQALRDIDKMFRSSSFLPDDRDAVHRDISQVRAIERNPRPNARRVP